MSQAREEFDHQYNLDSLRRIRPRGRDFELFITPRDRSHYVEHSYERLTASLVGQMCAGADLFVDVGAHFGFFSLLAATRKPELEVVALEPIPETFAILERNLKLNGLANVSLHRLAASDRPGRAPFHRSLASDNCGFYPHPAAPPIASIEVKTSSGLEWLTPLSRLRVSEIIDRHQVSN